MQIILRHGSHLFFFFLFLLIPLNERLQFFIPRLLLIIRLKLIIINLFTIQNLKQLMEPRYK